VHYVESSPAPGSQPVLHTQEYAKPGDELRFKHPCIIDVESGMALVPDTRLFDRQYDLYGPQWNADSRGVTFEYNERGHKNYRVLEMSAIDGSVRPLVEESHDKYVNYSRIFRHMLSDGKRIIWSSERDNYNHLYMYDRATGQPVCQITRGPWYVREIIDIDEQGEKIYFSANGVNTDEDPYFIRYYSINFDGSGMTDLTPAKGTHKATMSYDNLYIVDTYSTTSTPPVTILRDTRTGQELMKVCQADISPLLSAGWKAPEVFVAPGRDGVTPMWGIIYRPSNFDPDRKYPVVEYIYQGPGDQYVPKSFMPYNRYTHPLAELGFVVVMVDGMGTSFRSRQFENVCYKNLVDAGLPDHIAWIKAAGERYPYLDLERVGIYGGSAGGQESTTAVLHHPEFYKAAYSACGCHDNRMDKIWWNEQWLGYPVDESYIKASNVENAHLLTRPLMLVIGELDDNVDPASTMQVAAALIKADKDFELVVLPGVHHTLGEEYGEHKRFDFFVKTLLGVTPPAWNEITR
ncbi:MAG: prolyl oligopeptidase family serine peptidase, partial [Muribaculaceae bacterium]|nr:prolyl oligopeptidase family serine peptidase [Muribaculaceae bacterium]